MISSRKRRGIEVAIFLTALLFLATMAAQGAPSVTAFGIPTSADAGRPIPVNVSINSASDILEVRISYSNPSTGESETWREMAHTSGDNHTGIWSFEIPAQPWESELNYLVTAKDVSGASSQISGQISIVGMRPPRPFPWNLVIIIAFLGVVLVLTELTFKPGVYRKTGRQKASELEEEDRLEECSAAEEDDS